MAEAAKVAIAPALVVVALVLDYYGRTAGHWTEVLRPIAVLAVGSTAVSVGAYVIARRAFVATYLGVLATCAIVRPGLALPVVAIGLAILAIAQWRRIQRRPIHAPSLAAAIVPSALLVSVGMFGLVQQGAITLDDFTLDLSPSATAARSGGRPSVYVLLLDGYPRADSLSQRFDIDNALFLRSLERLGFAVNSNARSRFAGTELSLASSMLTDPRELDRFMVDRAERMLTHWRDARREYLHNVAVMDRLREQGYRLVEIESQVSHTQWAGWDETIDTGQLTDVEVALIQASALSRILDGWVMDQQRERLESTLDAWADSATDGRQKVSFAHIMAPHPPFLYGPANEKPLPCWYDARCSLFTVHMADLGLSDADYGARLAEHLAGVNERVIDTVERIVAADPGAIIVLFADHGGRFDKPATDEWYRTFLASRNTPRLDGPDGLFVRLLESTAEAAVND